jgi:chitin disaccharide deacetylase
MRVIINADDLGLNGAVNARVFDLMSKRQLTSATILISAPAAEAAVEESSRHPDCSFGLHLNIIESKPLSRNEALKPLLDHNGEFAGKDVLRRTPMTRDLRNAILEEWSMQVQKAVALGLKISHLDSHHYTHTMPSLFPVLKRLQMRFGLRKVRNTQTIYANPGPAWIPSAKKRLWTCVLRYWYATKTTDAIAPFSVFHSEVKGRRKVAYRSLELMTHPGAPADEEETQLLATNWQSLVSFPLQLINYHEL